VQYAGVHKWIDHILEETRKKGFVETLAGRRRPIPDINASNRMVRGFAERTAMNTPIQGSSADIIKAAMIKLFNEFHTRKMKTRMLVQVHDELLFEVPQNEVKEALVIIKQEMESAMVLKVPLIVDIKKGENWSDMEKVLV